MLAMAETLLSLYNSKYSWKFLKIP